MTNSTSADHHVCSKRCITSLSRSSCALKSRARSSWSSKSISFPITPTDILRITHSGNATSEGLWLGGQGFGRSMKRVDPCSRQSGNPGNLRGYCQKRHHCTCTRCLGRPFYTMPLRCFGHHIVIPCNLSFVLADKLPPEAGFLVSWDGQHANNNVCFPSEQKKARGGHVCQRRCCSRCGLVLKFGTKKNRLSYMSLWTGFIIQ
jgi:hypothetical protein